MLLTLLRSLLGLARGIHPELAWRSGQLLGHLVAHLPLRDVARAREHLRQAFPERDGAWVWRTSIALWRHVAGTAGWTITTAMADPRRLRRGVMVEGGEHLKNLVRAGRGGRGTVVFSGHLGNWELLPRLMGTIFPCTVIGRRLRSPLVDGLIQGLRESGGLVRVVYQDGDMRELMRDLRRGMPVATLNDQDIPRLDGGFVPWFGELAYTPLAPAALAQVSRVPVQAVFLLRRHGRWVIHASPRLAIPRGQDRLPQQLAITAWVAAYEEALVRGLPEQWMWWHKRWRTRPTDRPDAPGAVSPPA